MDAAHATARPLSGLRVIEYSSFVAGPSAGLALAQLGADVIRVDPLGGAADFTRWPLSRETQQSLFWTHLNRGKRSVTLDTRSERGRELLVALATAPGENAGILLDNTPGATWMSYETLASRRPDVIKMHIQGRADGSGAVDYTVNPEVGIPWMTGPEDHALPVNHVVPAWDLLTGMTAATALLAALRHRERTGEGADLRVALTDVALAGVANMGWLTEADELGADRPRVGNHLYGSYGADFATADGERVMVVALTARQWQSLCRATGTEEVFATLAAAMHLDWRDEGTRFTHRELIGSILRPWFLARPMADVADALTGARALWSRYGSLSETVSAFRSREDVSVLADVEQPGIGTVVSARSPIRFGDDYGDTQTSTRLSAHTAEVLTEVLGLSTREIGHLVQTGTIGADA